MSSTSDGPIAQSSDTAAPGAARVHWSLQVLAIFLAGRLVSTLILVRAAAGQGVSPWAEPAPGYGTFITFWDSGWYERIFREGYPSVLPVDQFGTVVHNQWAFYPLFPGVVRVLDIVTGLGWGILAPAVSVAAAAAASLIVYRLFLLYAAHRAALAGVAVVSFAPVAAILQIPYAESLHLLLLAAALYLLACGRYYAVMPVVVLMCFSRPAGVPFAVAVGILFLRSVWIARRGATEGERSGARDGVFPLFLLGLVAAAAAVTWPLIAWVATGRRDAYVATETAWRGEPLAPFLPWFDAPSAVLGPVAGGLLVVALVLGAVALFFTHPVRRLGPVLTAWCAGYLLYLAAFWDPQSSTWRILVPLFPLALAVATPRGGRALWIVVPISVVLQVLWVDRLWVWTPSGPDGDYPP
ncbi:hypothetical protein FJV46_04280 [Arthrobacter agilis]|uniref:hypothetical protein n=1 Tax=Arthrobacter agilis TaxID=37921 RepID=UPI000B3602FA|nr:hypothetical protein [Arthrobacter agilis]OUM41380.1 hypothetical protein B8W74_10760 [Arthrobacter agilis]PPB46288.1 hypothetical protein CI784_08130 [Arthrobacter agilis]TPV27045.1 hypothetical protein FJV46_04280 [Arthrobacter agilis]VDR32806.1 Predicted integral membrane protein [Arthrobacter agilis]